MAYDPEKHHRRSIRLKGHDYAGGGTYFITLCAHQEAGDIFADSAAKEILSRIWEEIASEAEGGAKEERTQGTPAKEGRTQGTPAKEGRTQGTPVRAGLVSAPFSPYIIMPDHFHALIRIQKGEKALGDFLCAFKSRTTHEYIQGVKAGKLPPFKKKIWHRNYYEMIVRSVEAEQKIAEYIRMNPWKCVQNLGNGLRGIGNPSLWHAAKLGVLCSRNAPVGAGLVSALPEAEVYLGGWHSPKEKEIFDWLLQSNKRIIACPAWGLEGVVRATSVSSPPLLKALEQNRLLILEMRNRDGDLAAAEQRNRFVIENADRLFVPHRTKGGMLDRLLKTYKQSETI